MRFKDIFNQINEIELTYDFKQVSFEAFLKLKGFEIIDEDYINFEYSDIKAYLFVKIKKIK